jgi:glucokinase
VLIVNDFLAVGYGLLTLNEATECVCLHDAPKIKSAPIACVGAGTGLGECFLTPDASTGAYRCFPSEGGHAEFAPRNEVSIFAVRIVIFIKNHLVAVAQLEIELLTFLKHKFEQKHRVSVERVVSGIGLANVYEFLASKYPAKVDLVTHHQVPSLYSKL